MEALTKPSDSLQLILIMLRFSGGFPPEKPKWLRIVYGFYSFGFIFIMGFCFVVSQFVNLFFLDDLMVLADSSYLMIEQIAMLIKVYIIVTNWKKVHKMIEYLKSPLFESHRPEQDHYVKDSVGIVVMNARMFYICVTVCCTLLGCTPLLMGVHQLPQVGWFPFNVTRSPTFEIIFLWQGLSVLTTAYLNASIDLFSSGVMALACGQLNVVADSLRNVRKQAVEELGRSRDDGGEGMGNKISFERLENGIYQEIVKCVKHHDAVLEFLSLINDTFQYSVFAQFAASVLVICLTAFELTVISLNDPKIYSLITYQIVMLSEIFLYCWYGNEVYYASLSVFDAASLSAWNKSGKKVRQAICIIMNRARKPVQLKAGNFLALTLDTFIAILRLSYSFLALLQQAHSDSG